MKKSVFIILISLPIFTISQNEEEDYFDYFYKYSDWGFSANIVSYRNINFERNTITEISAERYKGVQLGASYHIHKGNELSFNTGVLVNYMPKTRLFFTLRREDVYIESQKYFQGDLAGQLSVQTPVNLEIKKRLGHFIYFNANAGAVLHFLDKDFESLEYSINDENSSDNINVFSLVYDDDIETHISARLSAGIYILFKDFMLKTNLIYDKLFNAIFESEYRLETLTTPEPVIGNFKFSGDYIGFSTTVFFKKRLKTTRVSARRSYR